MLITLSCAVSLSFLFYVCVFGGSSTGFIGRLHRTLTRCSCFTICCGDRCARGLQKSEEVCCLRPNPALQLFYLGLVLSGLALFMYSCFPFVANPRLSAWHGYTPYPAVGVGLLSFFLACYCDPGTISAASLHRFSREPYDGIIYKPKMCPTCMIPRPARSKHCVICNRCVAKFDHHCPWINTCVGERNYRFFLFFLGYHSALCFYAAYLHYHILHHLAWDVHRLHEAYYIDSNGQHARVSRWQGFQYLLLRHNIVVAVGIFCFVIALALLGFWGYHIWLIRCGTTTNETFKWSDLKFDLTRAAKKAAAAGGRTPSVRLPPNAYNRGFGTNMAHVMFPLSSRPVDGFAAALAAGGALAGICEPAGVADGHGFDGDGPGEGAAPATGEGQALGRVRHVLHED